MKIIKKHCVQTWFSPKRCMEEMTSRSKSYYEIGDKSFYVLLNSKWTDRMSHRKIGPAHVYLNHYMGWNIKGLNHRIDGPNIINASSYKNYKEWAFKDYECLDEEVYWNE
ncbi:MAG: hypothetical protein AABY22_30055 [Nanoarchaeota archaeon]